MIEMTTRTLRSPSVDSARMLRWRGVVLLSGALAFGLAGCDRGEARAGVAGNDHRPTSAAATGCAGHAVCAEGFSIDAVPPQGCTAGAQCAITLQLVARGDFHINDEYPYRYSADEEPGVRFDGTDRAGRNVFSKPAGDWQKSSAKSGEMKVRFTPTEKGSKAITGTFKLSVCSAETCLLEQRQVSASFVAN
ncbi:MAG TPA: hypothetical protein VEK07_00450 [Polyangiaceae bacterium]|nr:hypothetical protein [Polyangiaceae bacterium]